jgi:hypothetical protein
VFILNFPFVQDMKQMDRVYNTGKGQEIEDGNWCNLLFLSLLSIMVVGSLLAAGGLWFEMRGVKRRLQRVEENCVGVHV